MYTAVACRMNLFTSNGNFLSPYKGICKRIKRIDLKTSVRSKARSTGMKLGGGQTFAHEKNGEAIDSVPYPP